MYIYTHTQIDTHNQTNVRQTQINTYTHKYRYIHTHKYSRYIYVRFYYASQCLQSETGINQRTLVEFSGYIIKYNR